MKKNIFIFANLFLVLMLSSCGGGQSGGDVVMDEPVPSGAENLMVVELEFTADVINPARVTVPADTEVLLVLSNSDEAEDHNLVGPEIGMDEILVVPGQTARRVWKTYNTPGEYRVGCTIHPWIDMVIEIEG